MVLCCHPGSLVNQGPLAKNDWKTDMHFKRAMNILCCSDRPCGTRREGKRIRMCTPVSGTYAPPATPCFLSAAVWTHQHAAGALLMSACSAARFASLTHLTDGSYLPQICNKRAIFTPSGSINHPFEQGPVGFSSLRNCTRASGNSISSHCHLS